MKLIWFSTPGIVKIRRKYREAVKNSMLRLNLRGIKFLEITAKATEKDIISICLSDISYI